MNQPELNRIKLIKELKLNTSNLHPSTMAPNTHSMPTNFD